MTLHIPATERKAEENMRKWALASHVQQRLAQRNIKKNVGPYITLSRETGAGASELAVKIRERLGWDILDKEIVEYLVEHYGTPRSLVEFVDEKHSNWLAEITTSWIDGLGFSQSAYTHRLGKLFLLAAHHGNVIIVGRGARFVLPHDRGFAVRVLAPLHYRIEQMMQRRGVNEKEARTFIRESDHDRDTYVKYHFDKKAADPQYYDLLINIEKLTLDDAADLIVSAAQAWMKKSGVQAQI